MTIFKAYFSYRLLYVKVIGVIGEVPQKDQKLSDFAELVLKMCRRISFNIKMQQWNMINPNRGLSVRKETKKHLSNHWILMNGSKQKIQAQTIAKIMTKPRK